MIEFTAAVFAVYLLGGALIAIGPGELLRSLVPHIPHTAEYIVEIVVGVALLIAAALLWRNRGAAVDARAARRSTRSAVERAARGDDHGRRAADGVPVLRRDRRDPRLQPRRGARQLVLLFIFNVCFVLPLIGIVLVLTFAGPRSERLLVSARLPRAPLAVHMLAILLAGRRLVALLLGVTGFAARGHNRFGRIFRHIRHFFHLHPRGRAGLAQER